MFPQLALGLFASIPIVDATDNGSGAYLRGEVTSTSGAWVLTTQQVAFAEKWTAGRKLNCLAGAASPPAPSLYIRAFRTNGEPLHLGLYSQPGYATVVETLVGKNLCHYLASKQDVESLRRAVGRQP